MVFNSKHTSCAKKNALNIGIFFLCLTGFSLLSSNASATTGIPVTPTDLTTRSCDASYFETLKSRSWLEGNRRMRQAQNYILKPDSILDYVCFPVQINIAAEETEQIFSESHAGHCYPESLDCSLDILVMSSLVPYLNTNFNHTFLGGKSNMSRDTYDPNNTDMCTVMREVWTLAKCMNFMLESTQDGFYTFQDYSSLDPRRLPVACTNNTASEWTDNINNSFSPTSTGAWRPPLTAASGNVAAIQEQFLGPGAGAAGGPTPYAGPGCGSYIETGIIVQDDASVFFRGAGILVDGSCSNPGCAHDGSGNCVPVTF